MDEENRIKRHFLTLITLLLLFAGSCVPGVIKPSGEDLTPENIPSIPPPTEAVQGFLKFPFLSADAGNFNLLAGEQITITWVDAPPGAIKFDLILLDQDGETTQRFVMTQTAEGKIEATWRVPLEISATLEGTAYFSDGHVVHSGCCAHVYSNKLPPDGICSLVTAGNMPQHLYIERDAESERTIGIAPGLYLEVLASSTDEWFRVRTLPNDRTADQFADPGTTGWLHSIEGTRLLGPCEEIPFETIPKELQQDIQADKEPAG